VAVAVTTTLAADGNRAYVARQRGAPQIGLSLARLFEAGAGDGVPAGDEAGVMRSDVGQAMVRRMGFSGSTVNGWLRILIFVPKEKGGKQWAR